MISEEDQLDWLENHKEIPMSKADGGAAFPRPAFAPSDVTCEDCEITDSQEGMSLRAWLAGEAGAKLCTEVDMDDNWDLIADRAVAYADAMIRRLKQEPRP